MGTIVYIFFFSGGGDPATLVYGPIRVVAAQLYRPGMMAGESVKS